ncbi:MAG: 8-oxoguanine DNA glycosylase [Clostridia bacterium]|nr:8-oxoguanine DNA glycosylase [Clostridia bacterium]
MEQINDLIVADVPENDFDCRQIFTCGQTFRWKEENGWWTGVAHGRKIKIRTETGKLLIKGSDNGDFDNVWHDYFDLPTDYSKIKKYLSESDPFLALATAAGGGIRLLKQEPFETLITFIISANNNIPRITKCVNALCDAFGEEICIDEIGRTVHAFPKPERLAALSADDISEATHAGYRCPYIVTAAREFIDRGGDISKPETYMGVGPKVASCVKLFTGQDMDAFPVDVWVKRLISELYFDHEPGLAEINDFIKTHFALYGGYAQQYLFYWRRSLTDDAVRAIVEEVRHKP